MASNVEFRVGSKHLRRVAIVAFLGVTGGAAISSCADSDTITTGGSNTTSSSSGRGGEGNAGGGGGAGGAASSSSSSSTSSSSTSSSSSGMGGSGGAPCVPTDEICDGKDNDCNDKIDDAPNGCDCVTGQTQNCYSGPMGTQNVGICKGGTQTCDANGKWGTCEGEVLPAATEKCEGTDDTCDGQVDEGCTCTSGQTQSCYTGPMGTANTGVCKPGSQVCDPTGNWGTCTGSVTPSPESCNGLDDDCEGSIDNGNPGGGNSCTAPGLGECKKGTLNCVNGAVKCSPAPVMPEMCDGLDNNCDGNTDEGNPGGGMQCMTGFMGLCATGLTKCDGMNGVVCQPNVVPGQLMEACNNIDDDCDGMVDDGITQVGQMCTKPGQLGVCQFGTYTCPMGATQLTCDAPLPGTVQETCNGKDDDCNGTIDDPILVNNQPCMTGLPGVCAAGTSVCSAGSLTCNATTSASPEICDNKDNNCNGTVDDVPNPTSACASQNPMAGGVSTWSCTMGMCQINTCAVGTADIDGAQGNGCECATDQHANTCVASSSLSVPAGSAGVNMLGKVETAMGSDWITFNFIAPAGIGTPYKPKVQLVNNAGGQYAMDVMTSCMSTATCNDGGSGSDISVWELGYTYMPTGTDTMPLPAPPPIWTDNDPKITSVKVRVYRKNGTPPTCDQYTVTATNL